MKKLVVIIAGLIGLVLLLLLDDYQISQWREKREAELAAEAQFIQTRLENALKTRILTTQYLKTPVLVHGRIGEEEFEKVARNLMDNNLSIRALQIADEHSRVVMVYPPQGNEITLTDPMVLLEDPQRGKFVEKAIRERRVSVQDPFGLRQGGLGFVIRNPIFDSDRFLGLAIAVLDVQAIVDEVLPEYVRSDYRFSLFDSGGNLFFSTLDPDTLDTDIPAFSTHGPDIPPQEWEISFADARWRFKLEYRRPWESPPAGERALRFLLGGGLLISLILFALMMQRRNEYLNEEIAKRTEELRASEKHFRDIVEKTPAGYFLLDPGGKIIDVNDAWLRLHGLGSREEALGKDFFSSVLESDRDQLREQMGRLLKGEDILVCEFSFLRSEGEAGYHLCTARTVSRDGIPVAIEGFLFDITDRKRAEEEKDILMQELNHRVKNNLLMISSMVRLKNSSLPDSVDLSDIVHQIDAIRIIHEKLYRTGAIFYINMRDYAQDLLSTIFGSFSAARVRIENKVEDLKFSTKKTVSLGLIINEIATNAMKYGFLDGEDAVFSISLKKKPDEGTCSLVLSNSGRPFPEGVDPLASETLGLRLVSILVDQMDGSMEVKKSPPTEFTIHFPCEQE
jgi:PAS domain S-box-containing protein